MGSYIVRANLNIHDGLLQGSMEFSSGLNIISGENGTLKTRLLQTLKSGGGVESSIPGQPLRIQAISPKRNSERRAAETILQFFRQNNRTWEIVQNERLNVPINDTGFDNYPSLGEFFYLVFEHRSKDGADRKQHMHQVTAEFNEVIRSVFPYYSLVSEWDVKLGAPRIQMQKRSRVEFPIEGLSLGEQEVLSLITNINAVKDSVDVYLIDEPEVHLNWHLEESLFIFLNQLCEDSNKQAIVVTHSRTIFKPRFLPKVQFLYWDEEGKVKWGKNLAIEQKQRLAGDAIEIIALGDFTKPTFFVEDSAHACILRALANLLQKDISISECGNSSNVKSLFKYQKNSGGWSNTYFLIDGDNQGNPFPGETQFIHLPVYCIENILLDPELLASISNRTITDIRKLLVQLIQNKRDSIFKKNKFFEFLADALEATHITYERLTTLDASLIINDLANDLGFSFEELVSRYLDASLRSGKLESLIPSLLSALNKMSLANNSDTGTAA